MLCVCKVRYATNWWQRWDCKELRTQPVNFSTHRNKSDAEPEAEPSNGHGSQPAGYNDTSVQVALFFRKDLGMVISSHGCANSTHAPLQITGVMVTNSRNYQITRRYVRA